MAYLKKLMPWFITEKGKRFTYRVVCATTIGICCTYTLPNTFFLDKYKEIVELYNSGIPVKVPKVVLDRYNTAIELLEIPEVNKQRIKPFTVFGFDVYNIGTIYSKFGGYVGIPINFSYESVDDINKSLFRINNETVDWSKPEADELLQSLILSEKAQLFGIAREIETINSIKLPLDTSYGISVVIFMYGLGSHINQKFNLYAKPFSLRLVIYSLIGCFGYGLYSFLTDFTQNQYERSIDEHLCRKNTIFMEGGKEFYEKLLRRNIALRTLMGPYGERRYSVLGNDNFYLRQKHMPIVVRRDYFANKAQSTV